MTTGHTDIYVGDALAVLQTLPAESVQCIVTSPPYYGLRDYGEDGQLGLEATPAEYVANLVAVLREARRVLRDDGVLWLNLGDSYAGSGEGGGGNRKGNEHGQHDMTVGKRPAVPSGLKPKDLIGIPWRVAFALQDDGWWLRSDCIWHKPNPMPESVTDRPTKAHEYVFLLSKSARYFYDAEGVAEESAEDSGFAKQRAKGVDTWQYGRAAGGTGINNSNGIGGTFGTAGTRNRRTVWTIATRPLSLAHFATMPPDLAEVCIKAGTSERGCCPECGQPWERLVERTRDWRDSAYDDGGKQSYGPGSGNRTVRPSNGGMSKSEYTTTGWQPTCDHDAEPVNCTVLDPFGGAGTTALVANRLGRDATIIELNPDYAELARRRIVDDAPMFASVDVIAAKEAALS